jgi:NADPH2:quinone reductase
MPHAIAYSELGGPDVLTLIDIDEPTARPGQVVVDVEAAGVNPIDGKLRSGTRPSPAIATPRRVGSDGAGVIREVGEGVIGLRPGQHVAFFGATGAYATTIDIDAALVHPLPSNVTPAHAAALGIPAGTAYQALRSLAVGEDDVLLVHAGSGAVGQAAIQFARLWGATVFATCSPRRFDRVRALGATPVAYGEGLEQRLREASAVPFTVALDAAGTDEAITASLALVADPNRIATVVRGADAAAFGIRAFQGGAPDPLSDLERTWRAEAFPLALGLVAARAFSVEIADELPLAHAATAHRMLENGVDGKLILRP